MDQPLVCVCIPCYNAEGTLHETLASIITQSYPNLEIHIFDNASTDNTVKIAREFEDDRIQFHFAEATSSGEKNFTRCLNLGRGKYTAIFHADDLYQPDIIEKEVQFLESDQDAGGVLTFANIINENARKIRTAYVPSYLNLGVGESGSFELACIIKAVLRENNFFFCPSAMIRTKTCIGVVKELREGTFGSGADLDAWLRIAEAGKLGLINLPLLQYRVSTSHFSHGYNKMKTDRADLFTILDYWMAKPEVAACLDSNDLQWYQIWLMRDNVVRARNALRKGDVKLAKEILDDVFFSCLLKDAMTSLRGLKFFALLLLTLLRCRVQ